MATVAPPLGPPLIVYDCQQLLQQKCFVAGPLSHFKPRMSSVIMSFYLRAILCVVIVTLTVISDVHINALDSLPYGFCDEDSSNEVCDILHVRSTANLIKNPVAFLHRVSRNTEDVEFLLYPDARKQDFFKEIAYSDSRSLNASGFNASKPVKILIHGFLSDVKSQFPQNVKNAYLKSDKNNEYSVIIVDWGKLAKPRSILAPAYYPEVTKNVGPTGNHVGDFIIWLRDAAGLDLRNVHLVGHSLGAHVSGQAGAAVYQKTGEKVGRITALDPAGPAFKLNLATRRIAKTDALFVDSYHTNSLMYGTSKNVGHVDFYLNSGSTQPGCLVLKDVCSHNRCHQLFSQMILEGPPSKKSCVCTKVKYALLPTRCCDDKLVFGEYCSAETRGEFFANYVFNCDLYKQVSNTCLTV